MIVRSVKTKGQDELVFTIELTGDPERNTDLVTQMLCAWVNEQPVRLAIEPDLEQADPPKLAAPAAPKPGPAKAAAPTKSARTAGAYRHITGREDYTPPART